MYDYRVFYSDLLLFSIENEVVSTTMIISVHVLLCSPLVKVKSNTTITKTASCWVAVTLFPHGDDSGKFASLTELAARRNPPSRFEENCQTNGA